MLDRPVISDGRPAKPDALMLATPSGAEVPPRLAK